MPRLGCGYSMLVCRPDVRRGSCTEQANTVGVAVTRKPTSAPCDHVKHPERLGVQWHDAGEATAAMVAEEVVSVEWASAVRRAIRSGARAVRLSGIPRIFKPAHACFSYLTISLII